jgi:hypothetical protein
MRLYSIRVDIYEEASGYVYPIVTHLFTGRTPEEARGYHRAHRQSDAFLRQCEDRGVFQDQVRCQTRVTEGWQTR